MAPENKGQTTRKKQAGSQRTWTLLRRIIQYSSILVFVVLFVGSRRGGLPENLVNTPMRLDPLLILSHLLSSRTLQAGSALALLTLLLTVIFGRAWCGWICPMGTTLDLLSFRRRNNKVNQQKIIPSPKLRGVKYSILIAILVAASFGNLSLLIFDPISILFRTLTTSIWPAVDIVITGIETVFYPIDFLSAPISTLDIWLRPNILPSEQINYKDAIVYGGVFLGVVLLNLISERFWCRYLCPLGGMLGLFSKFALFRREVSEDCKGCAICEHACPTGTIDPEQSFTSDPAECTMCMECLEVCPRSSIAFHPGLTLSKWQPYDPNRRQALVTFGITLASLAFLRVSSSTRRGHAHLIRPPGVSEKSFMSECIRCAECLRACPTSGLQPSLNEAGLEGLWTPVLIPRLGYCDYSCNACGQVCPVQAIPPMSLEEKRSQIIGKAYIEQDRCIAWSDHLACIVCEEMCPIPEKAIYLENVEIKLRDGGIANIQLPHVDRDKCIGCGICEYKCPVSGEAAIRILSSNSEVIYS